MKQLEFVECLSSKNLDSVFSEGTHVFSDSLDVIWDIDHLKQQMKNGWHVYLAKFDGQVVALFLMKKDQARLLTKSTPIKIEYQGNGFSHQIKQYMESLAGEEKVDEVVNYCHKNNFRGISLNESHGYEKTGKFADDDSEITEWKKLLAK